jgi:hypothetical protein
MAILKERKVWRREKPKVGRDQINRLTPEEQDNVMAAFAVIKSWRGTVGDVARDMGVALSTVARVASGHGAPSAGFALKLARAMKAPVENILDGKWRAHDIRPQRLGRRKAVVDTPRRPMIFHFPED